MVTLSGAVLRRYERFSLYNSPVAGEVLETRTVRCPPKSYAVDEDHLLLVDCGDVIARILHVEPSVSAGESLAVGDPIGALVRSGFFGQWVDNHLHLGFRDPEQNLRRATGSLPLALDVDVEGVRWDGIGTVVETGPTHVQLDEPPLGDGMGFAAIASDEGIPLDGGLAHYAGGGVLAPAEGEVSLLGTRVGTADGRDVTWADVAVRANGRRATGLSLFASRVSTGARVVFHEGHDFAVGDRLEVTIEPSAEPIRLG